MVNKVKHNYKNMEIWKRGVDIADEVYQLLQSFPNYERYGLNSQMSRSSVSISSNIAEGSSRTNKSFSYFLSISLGSSFELETQLIISNRRGYIKSANFDSMMKEIDEFQKMSIGFQKSLENKK